VDGPCLNPDSLPMWVFVAFAILSHIRGTVLLAREVLASLGKRNEQRRRRKEARRRRY
jgi:hypothetical protein